MPRPRVTFSRNGITSSGPSGPLNETSKKASYAVMPPSNQGCQVAAFGGLRLAAGWWRPCPAIEHNATSGSSRELYRPAPELGVFAGNPVAASDIVMIMGQCG